ncbi:hypothetical protein [Sulfurimonas sp.]|uniref:hypothetical protein n=1 Tax=Sulfurimonas sp. TaxID=2022749 RepID=UPI002629D26D|nr:hypothetical protein [Sulfurimonas sp.]MDD5158096.1 hypothetical protein [Sulfurimonas sp.]
MADKLIHDATKTIKPIFYQCYIALEKCFDLLENESVYIETYGDVTVMNKNGSSQTEVKDYEKDLTNLDHNIWKTLKNWLNDPNILTYKNLILLTTQDLSKMTAFQEWNSKNKNEKLSILKDINTLFLEQTKKAKETEELLLLVLDNSRNEKLLEILNKFIISSSQENDEELYKRLIQARTYGVPSDKKTDYINSLMGYIISPPITSQDWKITYQSFQARTTSLLEEFNSKTIIFPAIYRSVMATEDEEKQHSEYTFVKKIDEINYKDVKSDAISDFIYTRKTIFEELSRYEVPTIYYDNYEKEIHDTYKSKYNMASLGTENSKVPRDSKIFYNSVMGENTPNFRNFNDTPKRFRNGLLHQMADDESSENERKITWKLKVDEDE